MLQVRKISGKEGREYIREKHYTKTCHNGPVCWGLFYFENLNGVVAFANPCSEAVRESVFGPEFKEGVIELHRLFTEDFLPKNTESWFVSRAIKELCKEKPRIKAVISYADSTEGHIGYIYQALNFQFSGSTVNKVFFRDEEGRLRHPRQSGVNISPEEAEKRGWISEKRQGKFRYILLVGDRRTRRQSKKRLLWTDEEYPKKVEDNG